MVLQTGPGAGFEVAIITGSQFKNLVQHNQGAVNDPCRNIGPEEVPLLCRPLAAKLQKPRPWVVGDLNVGKELIVLEEDIVRRVILFNQIGFQQKGFNFRAGDDELHGGCFRNHALEADRQCKGLSITLDAALETEGFSHIENMLPLIQHSIHPRFIRQGFYIGFYDRDPGLKRLCFHSE